MTASPITSDRPDAFAYACFVERVDSVYSPADLGHIRAAQPTLEAVHNDERDAVIGAIVDVWEHTEISATAISTMAGVLIGLFDQLETSGRADATDLSAADDAELIAFVTTNPKPQSHTVGAKPSEAEMHLRRNVITGAFLALTILDVIDDSDPLEVPALARTERVDLRGKCRNNAAPQRKRRPYADRTHTRPATHDEVLITRLASRLVRSSTTRYLCTATVALITSTAATVEVPQILWKDREGDAVTLAGYARANGRTETEISARTVTLDAWAAASLDLWHEECKTHQRRIYKNESMTYTGRQELTSTSARATTDQQLRNATKLAGIDKIPGLTAGSFRLWAAIKDAHDAPGVVRAAELSGLHLTALHRIVHQLGERAL